MKHFIVTIFLSVAFSALVNAAQRKIAYDRSGKGRYAVKENCGRAVATFADFSSVGPALS